MTSNADTAGKPLKRASVQRLGVRFLLLFCLSFFLFTQAMVLQKILHPLSEPDWYIPMQRRDKATIDFFSFYECGYLVKTGLGTKVYDPEVQLKYFNDLIAKGGLHTDKLLYNLYPPYYFFFLIPLAWIPQYNIAYVVWCTLQTIFGLIGAYVLARVRPDLSGRDRAMLMMFAMSTISAYLCYWHGSTSFWVLGLHSLYLYFWWRKNDIASGAMLALSTIKYQYALMLSLPAFAEKRWKLIASAFAVEVMMLAAGAMTIGWQNVRDYPLILKHAETGKDVIGISPHHMISVRGLLSNILPHHDALLITGALLPIALLLWFLYLRKVFARAKESANADIVRRFALSLTIILMLCTAPHCHSQDSLVLVIPVILTVPRFAALKVESPAYQLWTAILLSFPVWGWLGNFMMPHEIFFSTIFLAMCLLFCLGLRIMEGKLRDSAQAQAT